MSRMLQLISAGLLCALLLGVPVGNGAGFAAGRVDFRALSGPLDGSWVGTLVQGTATWHEKLVLKQTDTSVVGTRTSTSLDGSFSSTWSITGTFVGNVLHFSDSGVVTQSGGFNWCSGTAGDLTLTTSNGVATLSGTVPSCGGVTITVSREGSSAGQTGHTAGATDVALHKPATESSILEGYPGGPAVASRCVDGNTDGNFYDDSVCHTNADAEAWWQIDLQNQYAITSINIWNRTDCCSDRVTDFYVFISPKPFASTDLAATMAQRGVVAQHVAGTAGTPTTLTFNTSGRYVRVQLAGTNNLHMAEVQVYGTLAKTIAGLTMVLPGRNAILTGAALPFSWKPYPQAGYYDLQIWLVGRLPDQIVSSKTITIYTTRLSGTSYQLSVKNMPPGIYHWRMAATDATGTLLSTWTPEGTVTIPSATGGVPAADSTASPALTTMLPGPNTLLTGSFLPFAWNPDSKAAYYDLQIWLVKAIPAQPIVQSALTTFTARLTGVGYKLSVKAMPKGIYHWRMAATDSSGALSSGWTKEQAVTIQ